MTDETTEIDMLRTAGALLAARAGHWSECPLPPDAYCTPCHEFEHARRVLAGTATGPATLPDDLEPGNEWVSRWADALIGISRRIDGELDKLHAPGSFSSAPILHLFHLIGEIRAGAAAPDITAYPS